MSFVVEARGLVKRYGSVEALRGLDLTVGKGVFGLVGPNAAGKSTTVKILLGLVRATGGKARVFGLDVWKQSHKVKQRVGVLHEKPSFPGWVKGIDYVEFLARLKGCKNPREEALGELKAFGLADGCERKIGGYSAGMVQRLGLAQAFVGSPELVFLDEPTANLDPLGRAEFLDMLKERSKSRGVSVVISTHVLSELERICESIAIICGGVVVESGTLAGLFEKYSENVYVVESSDDKLLAGGLEKLGCVERVWFEEDALRVKVKDQRVFEKEVVAVAHGLSVGVRRFEPVWHTLEHVYKRVLGVKSVGA